MYFGPSLNSTLLGKKCFNSTCSSNSLGVSCLWRGTNTSKYRDFCLVNCNYSYKSNPGKLFLKKGLSLLMFILLDWMYPECFDELLQCYNLQNPLCNSSRFLYTGNKSVTISGQPCVPWNTVTIFWSSGSYVYPYSYVGTHNYCRKRRYWDIPFCYVNTTSAFACYQACPISTTTGTVPHVFYVNESFLIKKK